MSVSFYNFSSLHDAKFRESVLPGLNEIMAESSFIEGKYNQLFEESFAKEQGADHCLLVANGTDAIEISLTALDLPPRSFVAVPAITFHATAEAVLNVGAIPVFIDINPLTGQISLESLQKNMEEYDIKAAISVDIYGIPAPLEDLTFFLKDKNCALIEDAAQAVGAQYEQSKKNVGSMGHLTTFSFYPTKNLGAFGDAGGILTNDSSLAEKIRALRNHGRGQDFGGRNSRCDSFQAFILYRKLKDLAALMEKRKIVSNKYLELFKDLTRKELIFTPLYDYGEISSLHLFPILLPSEELRDKLSQYLAGREIETRPFYNKVLGDFPFLKDFPGKVPHARNWAKRVLCLPIHPFLEDKEIESVASSVRTFLS